MKESDAIKMLANAITPTAAAPATDAFGGNVGSLTEAVLGTTQGLLRIAEAIDNLADAIREQKQKT